MVSVQTHKKIYTVKDYEKLPEGAPYQLMGGNLVMVPSPTPNHQKISREVEFSLLQFVRTHKLGVVFDAPIDVSLGETEVYQPDIIFISKERTNIIGEKQIQGAPDLVIEILSPSTAYYDMKRKKKVYEACGVKEYWLADPEEKTIEIYESQEGKFQLFCQGKSGEKVNSKLLEGFSLEVDSIFEVVD